MLINKISSKKRIKANNWFSTNKPYEKFFSSRGETFLFAKRIFSPREEKDVSSRRESIILAKVMCSATIEYEQMPCKSSSKALYNRRICLDFTVYCFYVILFRLFESLFGIFTFFDLANRPLFAATKQCKSSQKQLSTKLEIKSKQILNRRLQKTATRQKCNCIGWQ